VVSFIELYPEKRDDKHLIKTIHFTFPVTYDGESGALFVRTNEQQVETVVLLSHKKADSYIHIDVDVEELVQDKRGLATYEEIKAYVLEHTGLKVSHLYIAQVKQKYGIIERENYNKPKSENAKQPQCPPEKERAITEALKHFEMIS
jgi:site-specific DNA recombinase